MAHQRVAAIVAGVLAAAGLAAGLSGPSPASADVVAGQPALTATVIDLPAVPDGLAPAAVALDGATAYAGLRPAGTNAPASLYRTLSDGTGTWDAVIDPATGSPLQFVPTELSIDRGVILAGLPGGCDARLITPDEYRTVTGCDLRLTLDATAVFQADDGDPARPWSVRSFDGAVIDSGTFVGEWPPVIADGVRVRLDSSDRLIRRRLGAATDLTSQRLPSPCHSPMPPVARGDVVLVSCDEATALLRPDSSAAPFPLPRASWTAASGDWKLGEGFAVHGARSTAGSPSQVEIVDLGAGHRTLTLAGTFGRTRLATDPGPTPSLMLRQPDGGLQVARIEGLADPATGPEDTVAPVVESFTGPPAYATSAAYSWKVVDPGLPAAFTLQAQIARRPGADAQYDDAPVISYDRPVEGVSLDLPGYGVCVRVRGVDWAGNVGEWRGSCTRIDTDVPRVFWRTDYWRWGGALAPDASRPIPIAWEGDDIGGIARYDLAYRIAPAAGPLGGWVWPPEWSNLQTTRAQRVFPKGSQVCFRVRATDHIGNVGEEDWAQANGFPCVLVPLDDRGLTARGGARRVTRSTAYRHTATVLRGKHDVLELRGVLARQIVIRFPSRNPTKPCAVVTIGKARASTCEDEWAERRSFSFRFDRQVRGTLRIRPFGGRGDKLVIDQIYVGKD